MKAAGIRIMAGAAALILTTGLFSACSQQKNTSSAEASESAQASAQESASASETFGQQIVQEEPIAEESMLEETYEPDPDAASAMADSLLSNGTSDGNEENLTQFTDIEVDAYYYEALLWALDNGIISGTSDTTFSPDETCTRGQIVTLLYRIMSSPEVSPADNSFTDISDQPQETVSAIIWAAGEGITSGTGDGTFEPDQTVTRLQVVTFLWRLAGSPEPAGDSSIFLDTDAAAANWAAEQEITSVGTDAMFSPDDECTRGQVVTFLYRYCISEGVIPGTQAPDISAETDGSSVIITVGEAYVGDVTQEQLNSVVVEKGYQSATLNPDGSVEFVMSQTVYEQLITTMRSNIDQGMAAMPGSDAYPTVTTVYANDNYSVFTIQTSDTTEAEAADIPVEDLFLYSAVYAQYTQSEVPDVLVIIANEESGAILREVRSSDG